MACPNPQGAVANILNVRQALWTVVRHAGGEPTHHPAERALRPGVRWRTGRLGTHRAEGSRVVEAMLTVVTTRKPPPHHVLTL